MIQLTLRLPETPHQPLVHLAESEGVSLNQYKMKLAAANKISYV